MVKTKKKKVTAAKSKAVKTEKTLVAFLLDRSGSMTNVITETISGFNSYLDTLTGKPEAKDITVHFSQFDSESLDVIEDCVPLAKVAKLNAETFKPRSWTPLYDSIGKTIRAIEDQAKGFKVFFVTLTDGQENQSKEWNDKTIKDLIRSKEEKDKWTFSYIGIGPEAWAANAHLSAGTQGASNVLRATRGQNTQKAYGLMAKATMMRCATAGGQPVTDCYSGVQLDKDGKQK
jgi:uncharacterized protein YegL